jgi:hypothetical protein
MMDEIPSFEKGRVASKHSVIVVGEPLKPCIVKCLSEGTVTLIGYGNDDDLEVTYPVVAGEVIQILTKVVTASTLPSGDLIAWQ